MSILNNIDLAWHNEAQKSKSQNQYIINHQDLNLANGTVKLPQMKSSFQVKIPATNHKTVDKGNMWPIHNHKPFNYNNKKKRPLSIELYNKPVRTRRDWNGERYIVYLCRSNFMCAGWGDRQHGIFAVYLLSLLTNRTFKVDMQSPCPLNKLYHPRSLNWKVNLSDLEGLSSTHIYAMNDVDFRNSMKEIDFNVEYPQDVVYLTNNYDYFYALKSNPYYKKIFHQKVRKRPRPIFFADIWQGLFIMNKHVVRRFSPTLTQARPSKRHKLVCAHIRFGRNPTMPSDGNVRNTLSTIKPFWGFVEKYSNPDLYRLFVASDWQEFRSNVSKRFKDVTVDVEGDVIHIDKVQQSEKYKNKSDHLLPSHDDICSGFEKVIADQYILSQCDILLLTYSVFGKAAAYLRRSNDNLYLMEKGIIKPLMLFNDNNKHF